MSSITFKHTNSIMTIDHVFRRWTLREKEVGMKNIMEEMAGGQMNGGGVIKGRSTLGDLKAAEVVVVLKDNPEEMDLGTQVVESGRGGVAVPGKGQVVFHPRWRQEVLT